VGLYVPPGTIEEEFTWYVAFWGMPNDSKCERWEGEWGGIDERMSSGPAVVEAPTGPWTRTKENDNSLVRVSRQAIPSRVE